MAAAERIYEIIDLEPGIEDPQEDRTPDPVAGGRNTRADIFNIFTDTHELRIIFSGCVFRRFFSFLSFALIFASPCQYIIQ